MTRQRGFALISAIFILVVLAALGAFIVSVSTNQQVGAALDVQGVRAYQAARAGIEWGIYQTNATTDYNFSYGSSPGPVGSAPPNNRACPASSTSFAVTAATLAGFTVTVTCEPYPHQTTDDPTVYAITATACNQPSATTNACPNDAPGANYVERRLVVTF